MPGLTVTRLEQRAMGVNCAVTVTGADGFDTARRSLERAVRLELLWSRFAGGSDISRLNHSGGRVTFVDPLTVHLIEVMKAAHAATHGSFDPTHLDATVAAGDDASRHDNGRCTVPDGPHGHALDDIEIVDDFAVRVHNGVLLDAGGIGKGLAADIIAGEAMERGAEGVCVNMGGDLRCCGSSPAGTGWEVNVSSPVDYGTIIDTLSIQNGAVATSAVGARRRQDGTVPSHIINPFTGNPFTGRTQGASVVASSAAWAEAFAKHAIVSPAGTDDIESLGLACLTFRDDGHVSRSTRWGDFRR